MPRIRCSSPTRRSAVCSPRGSWTSPPRATSAARTMRCSRCRAPGSCRQLALASHVERLENVVAGGFPGVIMDTDINFQALRSGDATAIPQMAVTQGVVTVIQQAGPRPAGDHPHRQHLARQQRRPADRQLRPRGRGQYLHPGRPGELEPPQLCPPGERARDLPRRARACRTGCSTTPASRGSPRRAAGPGRADPSPPAPDPSARPSRQRRAAAPASSPPGNGAARAGERPAPAGPAGRLTAAGRGARWTAAGSPARPNQGLRPVGAPGPARPWRAGPAPRPASVRGARRAVRRAGAQPGRPHDRLVCRRSTGDAEPLDALEPAARAAAERGLRRCHDDIAALAARLAQSRDADVAAEGRYAPGGARDPRPSFIRVLGGRPVLLAWAHLKDSPDAPRGRARQLDPQPPAGAPPPGDRHPRRRRAAAGPARHHGGAGGGRAWMGRAGRPALAAVRAARADDRLADAVGLRPRLAGRPGGALAARCPLPAALAGDDSLVRELERQRQLEQEIAQLQRELARETPQCLPEPPPIEPTASPPETAGRDAAATPPECAASEIDRRREEAGGQIGEVTVSLGWDGPARISTSRSSAPNGNAIRSTMPPAAAPVSTST